MPAPRLPDGAYFSVTSNVRTDAGGQTRALLMRNRIFTQHGGVPTTVLTFDPHPVYPTERRRLTERGELVAGMQLRNIYEDYREVDLGTATPRLLPALPALQPHDVAHPGGGVHYTGWRRNADSLDVVRDHRRADGSVYLRAPGPGIPGGIGSWTSPWDRWVLTDHHNHVVHSWRRRTDWSRHWLRRLAGTAERVFVISDGRFAAEKVVPVADDRFHLLHLMHNVHVGEERRWNSPILPGYTFVLDQIAAFDGVVSLTERQREDVAQRYGATGNLFTVPNPVLSPPVPDPRPERAAADFAVVARFDRQKRLDHVVRVFALVVAARPQAQLQLYGAGATGTEVADLVHELGLDGHVHLRGWDPEARDRLWSATGFLVTSEHEGYPLATLESMSRGCPVVSYDIKYGPQEQITDGVDGYLVPDGDERAMADRVIAMIDDPGLVQRLSAAARQTALAHSEDAFLQRWSEVLSTVVEQRPDRARLTEVACSVSELGTVPGGRARRVFRRLPLRLRSRLLRPRPGAASFAASRPLQLAADVSVEGRWRRGALADARWSLDAVSDDGTVTPLPLRVRRKKRQFRLSSRFGLGQAFGGAPAEDRSVRPRLRLVLANAAWETFLGRPAEQRPPYEVVYDAEDRLRLLRR